MIGKFEVTDINIYRIHNYAAEYIRSSQYYTMKKQSPFGREENHLGGRL